MREAALAAAGEIGDPVVLKTDESRIAHKSDVGGVRRLGLRVVVCETAAPGTELAPSVVRDPAFGPLVVVGAGGVLVEIMAERAVLLAPSPGLPPWRR